MRKVLGVCGDSFFAATKNKRANEPIASTDILDSEGKHFSELLSKKIDYDLFTLARGACSNSAIRLQISELVKRKVDFIVVGTTTALRMEYPRYDNREYDPNLGIYNFYYSQHPDQSSKHFTPDSEVMYTDTITNIIGPTNKCEDCVRSEEQRTAVKSYYLELFDLKFREQQDSWIISSGVQEIRDAGIPYILLGKPWLNLSNYLKDSPRHILNDMGRRLIPEIYPLGSRRWHTTDQDQVELADRLYAHIIERNLLQFS